MDREYRDDELIELGAASVATKGGAMGYIDLERTKQIEGFGLSDD
ncbi:MAG: benenodin family lasso peptide [Bacillota bacterium]